MTICAEFLEICCRPGPDASRRACAWRAADSGIRHIALSKVASAQLSSAVALITLSGQYISICILPKDAAGAVKTATSAVCRTGRSG